MKLPIKNITQFALSLLMLVVIVDPTNTIFRLKELCFSVVLGMAIIDYKNLNIQPKIITILFLVFTVVLFSIIMGTVNGYRFEDDAMIGYLKAFLFLLLLCIVADNNFNFFKALTIPCVIISIIVIITYISVFFFPELQMVIYSYVMEKEMTIIIGKRVFLGIDVQSVFYKTSPVLTIVLAYYFNLWLNNKTKRKLMFGMSLLFFMTLLMAGTRANILSALLIIIGLWIYKFRKSRIGIVILVPVTAVFIFLSSFLVYKLLNDNEASNKVKGSLVEVLVVQISSNVDILLFGQGAGSTYDSGGSAHGITSVSELTYLEIIRMFGVFGAIVIIFMFIYPLILLFKNKPFNYVAFALGYMAYLFIGGTNPLLLGSTGFMVLAVAYSYALTYNKKENICVQ